jgi:endonuclease III
VPAGTASAELAGRLVRAVGGRYSAELGIDLDAGDHEVERWFLAATLFGNRISASIVERTYRTLEAAGIATIADVEGRTWDDLVALLDTGGYVRYDFRTATRLQELAAAVRDRYGGRVSALRTASGSAELEAALDALPGWGPTTVRLFLRELRGVWPGAVPPLDERALLAAEHLGLLRGADPLRTLSVAAENAGIDARDVEAGLVRLALRHRRELASCPGGSRCRALVEAES